ncbi:MAG: hypothetical protein GY696_02760 [Gammaproteobacteria bacterium]|nr:hypothetical protein [Gammaproteobacteria bacterium]
MANGENLDQEWLDGPVAQQQVLPLQPLLPPLHVVDVPGMDEERREYLIITKARDRLHSRVPIYHEPRTDDWGL